MTDGRDHAPTAAAGSSDTVTAGRRAGRLGAEPWVASAAVELVATGETVDIGTRAELTHRLGQADR